MASRAVAKESTKCRSGRDVNLTGRGLPSLRGGKMPHTFGDNERVAAEDDGDVVVPAREGAAFEVVEPDSPLSSS